MKFGDFQSLYQLMVGLNLAFYALKEIRSPYIVEARTKWTELSEGVQGTRRKLRDISDYGKRGKEPIDANWLASLSKQQGECEKVADDVAKEIDKVSTAFTFKRAEEKVGYWLALSALIGFILLVGASVLARTEVTYADAPFAVATLIFGYLPIFAGVGLNLYSASTVKDEILPKISALRTKCLLDLDSQIDIGLWIRAVVHLRRVP